MTERYSFAVDAGVVWNQDNIDNSALTDTMNESYATAEEDSPTRYLSVLDSSLETLNITLSNPKLEVEEPVENYEEVPEPESTDQVVVFSVEGSDDLYGIQVVQDEDGNMQKYQFQFRKNEDGQLEAIPETITLIPMEEELQEGVHENLEEVEYAEPVEDHRVQIFVEETHCDEHILPDNNDEEERRALYENEDCDEETVDIKPGVLQLQNMKQEIQESQAEYEPHEEAENQEMPDFQTLHEMQENDENLIEYHTDDNSLSSEMNGDKDTPPENPLEGQEYEHVEVSPDMSTVQTVETEETEDFNNDNTSDENDYQIVEGLHITGDVEGDEHPEKQTTNILKHALKSNKDSPKIVKKDNRLYLYVVQHPEKENVDSLSLEMSNLCKPRVNPRSILKSSHAMCQAKNEIDGNPSDERLNKRFARCKEAMQAMIFHNFINKTTIPQAPVRKIRLPRKQKIKPVERMDEEIVVQEVMVSSNGFVEAISAGVNKENLAVTEYVELTDSDDDYDPKKMNRKKKKHRRKKIVTISDESDASHDSIIDLDESDDETNELPNNTNNNTPPKRRRGRPPKNKPSESPTASTESPAKKSRVEPIENPTKPEIPCPKCDKTFPSQNSLKTHLQHHNLQSSIKKALPEYKYKCDNCATTFINNILLKKHMCSKLFNCSVCKRKFADLSALNGHKRTHAKEQMVKSTTAVQVSPKKIKVLPTNPFKPPKTNNLKCKACGKLCSSMQNLSVHVKTHKEFVCGTCSKTFLSQLMLEKHLRENCVKSPQLGRRSLRAKSPGKRATLALPTRLRTKSTVSPEKKFSPKKPMSALREKCDLCSMQFSSYQALFKHKVLKHGLETPDKQVLEEREEKGKDMHGGVPATRKLNNIMAGLRCQLDFNE